MFRHPLLFGDTLTVTMPKKKRHIGHKLLWPLAAPFIGAPGPKPQQVGHQKGAGVLTMIYISVPVFVAISGFPVGVQLKHNPTKDGLKQPITPECLDKPACI